MELQVQFETLNQVGEKLKKDATDYLEQINLLRQALVELGSYWVGPDKDYFVQEVETSLPSFDFSDRMIHDYGVFLTEVAHNLQELQKIVQEKAKGL